MCPALKPQGRGSAERPMAEFIVYTADGDYYALAQTERLAELYLREIMIIDHRPGYAKPYPAKQGGAAECSSTSGLAPS